MAAKLKNITTQYHTFEDNQVLTKDQLNEFINYFEDQDRMSRVFLSGVGIVCGLELKISSAKTIITISQGAAVTTDGDLLKLQKDVDQSSEKTIDLSKVDFKYFKDFDDKFASYSFFKKTGATMNMWEILPEKEERAKPLNQMPNIENKVVLLYLESYAKEGDLCTSIDCDNQGVEQVARLRILLVSKTDAAYIAGHDTIFSKHDIADDFVNLPELAVRRVVLNSINTASYTKLKRAYYQALTHSNDNFKKNLVEGVLKIFADYSILLKLSFPKNIAAVLEGKLEKLLNFQGFKIPSDIQYRYDSVKDIVDTYNELKTLLLSLKEECCPDINAFPKHILLGQIDEIGSTVKHNRHGFYKSPALNGNDDKIAEAKNLVLRLYEIIRGYHIPTGETKITPSNKLLALGSRAIPFYYNVQTGLLSSWNFSKTEKNRQDTNLSYHTANLSPALPVQNPLAFNMDKFDFYRIEGHQGKNYKQVLEEIDDIKRQYGLAFDVKALSVNINKQNIDINDYECEFEDLSVLLRAWKAEQECTLAEVAEFFSGFSTITPGKNVKEIDSKYLEKDKPSVAATSAAAHISAATGSATMKMAAASSTAESGKKGMAASTKYTTKGGATYGRISLYSRPATYVRSDAVTKSLTVEENSLGVAVKEAIEEAKGGSVDEIVTKAHRKIDDKVKTDEWKNKPDVKELVIDQSVELVANAYVLSQKIPNTLAEVTVENMNSYTVTMKNLCNLVKVLKTGYQNIDISVGIKAILGVLINQLSTICCSAKKIKVLLDEIDERKENILLRLQLSKFVEKHPGLEHIAGVEPGGTFVLVYLSKPRSQEEKERKEAHYKFGEVSAYKETDLPLSHSNQPKEMMFAGSEIEKFKENLRDKYSQPFGFGELNNPLHDKMTEHTGISNNTVVADFSLPYMCCSDCAPVNFIIARPPVSLRLEKDEFCLGKDSSPLLFEVSPADGIIKADTEVKGMTIEGNKLTFDAAFFPKEMLGKPIHFTVNEQITECEITVYRAIQFDFAVPQSPTTETEITFIPTGDLDGATFLWSFGDDNLSTDRNPTHKYAMSADGDNKVTVSLTVTAPNGVCQTTVEHDIEFKVAETTIRLAEDNYCENDKNSYPFTISPPHIKVKIEGEGVSKNDLGEYVFIPAAAKPGTIEFVLNEKPSGVKVTVNAAPVAKFTPIQNGNQLVLQNNSTGATSFIWLINDRKHPVTGVSSYVIDLKPNSPSLWHLQLQAITEMCGTDESEAITFETKYNDNPPVNNCFETTGNAISVDLGALSKLQNPNSELVIVTWNATSGLYGGTPKFKNGVLNDLNSYLTGINNQRLESEFLELLIVTANRIIEIDRKKFKDDFNRLVQMFGLQLRLFYNILGCQDAAVIKEFGDMLKTILDRIIKVLVLLQKNKVKLPATLRVFIKKYSEQVEKIELLAEHLKIISENKLI